MIFNCRSNLPFAGLHKIQQLLESQASGAVPDDVLMIIASLPSLSSQKKDDLHQLILEHRKIIFWCYGDLLWNVTYWKSIEILLKKKEVCWVVASERWKKIAELFIPAENIFLGPHPVGELDYRPSLRSHVREKLGIKDNEKLLLYAGRRSFQKNLPLLWKLWRAIDESSSLPVKFAMAGPWCDYGQPQFPGPEQSILKTKETWSQLLKLFPEKLIDLGELSPSEMPQILQASDVALSLSTFLEEDYGLFLREARSLGVPVVASNWGGHAELKDSGSFLIDFQATDSGPKLDFSHALIQMKRAMQTEHTSFRYLPKALAVNEIRPVPFVGLHQREVADLILNQLQSIMAGL